MQKNITLRLSPTEADNAEAIKRYIAAYADVDPAKVTGYYPVKKSLDARSRQIWVNLTVSATIGEPFHQRPLIPLHYPDVQECPEKNPDCGGRTRRILCRTETH